jgi:stress-induced morphogen
MSQGTTHRWEAMRTDESRQVEDVLRKVFPNTDAYRFNSASIRVRVIDPQFEGKTTEERDAMIEPLLEQLPEPIQRDIMNLLTLSPSETSSSFNRKSLVNLEFEDPSRSMLGD